MAADLNDRVAKAIAEHLGKAPKAEPKPAEAVARKPVGLLPGQVWFSEIFDYRPKFGDFGVTVQEVRHHPDVARLVPSIDSDYVVQKDEAALLVAGLEDGDKSLITGPTGSGKSSLVKYVCAKLNRPFIRINMSGDVESAALFGTLVVRGGATVWEDGAITEAAKYGAVCLVDEWELMPAEIAMGMQNLLEDGGYLYLKEKPGTSEDRTIVPHADFRLVFAGNTFLGTGLSGATGSNQLRISTGSGTQLYSDADKSISVYNMFIPKKDTAANITGTATPVAGMMAYDTTGNQIVFYNNKI